MSTMSMEIMTYKGGCIGREETEEKVEGRIIHKPVVEVWIRNWSTIFLKIPYSSKFS